MRLKLVLPFVLLSLIAQGIKAQDSVKKLFYNDPVFIQKFVNEQRDTSYLLVHIEKFNQKVDVYFDSAYTKKAIECEIRNGKKNGTYSTWHRNGNIKAIEHFKDGVSDGRVDEWNLLGIKLFEGNYVKGIEDGYFRNWYGNGVLSSERLYNMGLLDGLVRTFYISGKKQTTEFYNSNFGEKDGTDSAWFEDGSIGHLNNYKMGILEGASTIFYENGNKRVERTFKNNKRDGPVMEWEPDGKLNHLVVFKNDFPIKEEKYYDNGQKIREVYFKENTEIPEKWTYWDRNGKEIDRKKAPKFENDWTFPATPQNTSNPK